MVGGTYIEVPNDYRASQYDYTADDYMTKNIDRDRCVSEFEKCYSKEEALIKRIKINRVKVLNSGIKMV